MSRKHRVLHLITLIALIFNMLAPLVSFDVSAQDSTPDVTAETPTEEPTLEPTVAPTEIPPTAVPTEVPPTSVPATDTPTDAPTSPPTAELPATTKVAPIDPPFPLNAFVCVDEYTLINAHLKDHPTNNQYITYSFADPDPTTDGELVLLAKVVNGAEWDTNANLTHWLPLGYHQYLNPANEDTYRIYSKDGVHEEVYDTCLIATQKAQPTTEPTSVVETVSVTVALSLPDGSSLEGAPWALYAPTASMQALPPVATGVVGADNSIAITDVLPGDYHLVISPEGKAALTADITVGADATPVIEVELDPVAACVAALEGEQADIDGDGIADVCDPEDNREKSLESSIRAMDTDGNEVTEAISGATIVFEITITNTGETDVNNLVIDSNLQILDLSCKSGEGNLADLANVLEPGETMVCSGTYLVPETPDMRSNAATEPSGVAAENGIEAEIQGPQMRSMSIDDADALVETTEVANGISLQIEVSGYSVPAEGALAPAVQIFTAAGITLPVGVTPVPNNSTYRVNVTQPTCSADGGKYADCVVSVDPGRYHLNNLSEAYACRINNNSSQNWVNHGSSANPQRSYSGGTWSGVLGAPDGSNTTNPDGSEPSIGWGGILVVEFTDNRLVADGTTAKDLKIWERGSVTERANLYVSNDGVNWIWVGLLGSTPNTALQEFDIDPYVPAGSIFKYVMIHDLGQDTYQPCGTTYNRAGADIDSIEALSSTDIPVNPGIVTEACVDGVQQEAKMTLTPDNDFVEYTWSSNSIQRPDNYSPSIGETMTVVARLKTDVLPGLTWRSPLPTGWSLVSPGNWSSNATRTITLQAGTRCTPSSLPVIDLNVAACVNHQAATTGTFTVNQPTGFTFFSLTRNNGQTVGSPAFGTAYSANLNQSVTITLTRTGNAAWPTPVGGPWNSTINGLNPDPNWTKVAGDNQRIQLTFTMPAGDPCPPSSFPTTAVAQAACVAGTPQTSFTYSGGTGITITEVRVNGTPRNPFTSPVSLNGGDTVVVTATVSSNHALPTSLASGISGATWQRVGTTSTYTLSFTAPTVVCKTTLTVAKSASNSPITVGQNPVYTITVTNTGAVAATGVIVTDTLPVNAGYTWSASGTGWTCTPANASAGSVITCNLTGSLASGATSTTITVTGTPGQGSVPTPEQCAAGVKLLNLAKAKAGNADETPNDDATVNVNCIPTAPTFGTAVPAACVDGVTTGANTFTVNAGIGVTTIISEVRNSSNTVVSTHNGAGTFNLPNASGTYTIRTTFKVASGFTAPGGWTLVPGTTDTYVITSSPITVTICDPVNVANPEPPVPAACTAQGLPQDPSMSAPANVPGSVTYSAVTKTPSGSGFIFTFTATAASGKTLVLPTNPSFGTWAYDPTTGQKSVAKFTSNVISGPDCKPTVGVSKAAVSATVTPTNSGAEIAFKITVKNTGNGVTPAAVQFQDVIPAPFRGLTWTAVTAPASGNIVASTCDPYVPATGLITCASSSPLAPNQSVEVTISAKIYDYHQLCGPLTNTVTVVNGATTPGTSSAEATVQILCKAPTFVKFSQNCVNNVTSGPSWISVYRWDNGFEYRIDGLDAANAWRVAPHTYGDTMANPVVPDGSYTLYARLQAGYAVPDMTGWTQVGETNVWSYNTQIVIASTPCSGSNLPGIEVATAVCLQGTDTVTFTVPTTGTGTGFENLTVKANNVAIDPTTSGGTSYIVNGGTTVTISVTLKAGFLHPTALGSSIDGATWVKDGNTYTLTFTAKTAPCLTIAKTADKSSYNPGDQITYTITVTNTGSGAATNKTVTDTLPAGLTYVTGSTTINSAAAGDPSASGSPVTLTWTGINVPAKSGQTAGTTAISFKALIPANGSVCGAITNTAKIDSLTALKEVNVNCLPGLSVDKVITSPAGEMTAPGTITYSITVTNTGNVTLTNVSLIDVLTGSFAGTGVVWPTPTTGWTLIAGVPVIDTLEPGAANAFTISGITYQVTQADIDNGGVALSTPEGTKGIKNCVTATSGNTSSAQDCVETPLTQVPNLTIEKDAIDSVVTALPDGTVELGYTITVTNTGNITVANGSIDDTMLAGLLPAGSDAWTIAVEEDLSGAVTDLTPAALPITFEDLAPGMSITIKVTNDVPAGLELPNEAWCTTFTNQATVTGSYANDTAIGENGLTSDPADITVNCTGLDIVKTTQILDEESDEWVDYTGSFEPGDTFRYQIVVSNNGNTDVYNLVVTDDIPDTLIVGSVDPVDACDVIGNSVSCEIELLESGSSVTITINVEVPAVGEITWEQCQTPLENTAYIYSFTDEQDGEVLIAARGITPPGGDPIPSDPTYNEIDCDTGITVEKTAGEIVDANENGRVDAGEVITYTIVIKNTSSVTLENVDLTDLLPGVDFGSQQTTDLMLLPYMEGETPDNSLTLTATYVITQLEIEAATNLNCVLVTGETGGTDSVQSTTVRDDDCVRTPITRVPGIKVEKVGPESVLPGETFSYTITITNTGNVLLTAPVNGLIDTMPAGTTNWAVTNLAGVFCFFSGSNLYCLPTLLAPNASVSVTVTGKAPAQPSVQVCDAGDQALVNKAIARGSSTGGNVSGDSTVNTDIVCAPKLEYAKVADPTIVEPGDPISFDLVVTNTGTYPSDPTTITDNLPAGLAGLTWTLPEDCDRIGDSILCDVPAIPAYTGNSVTITISAETTATAPVCGIYTNQMGPTTGSRNQLVSADVEITCVPNLDVEKDAELTTDADESGDVSVGDTITYTITVNNTGNQPLEGEMLDFNDDFDGVGDLVWPDGFDGHLPNIPVGDVEGNPFVITATYVVTQDDIDAQTVNNCADVALMESEVADGDCADLEIPWNPDVAVDKTSQVKNDVVAPGERMDAGDKIFYTITVVNTGNVTLSDIEVVDALVPPAGGTLTITDISGKLADDSAFAPDITTPNPANPLHFIVDTMPVGSTVTVKLEYVVDQIDIDFGKIENCVSVSGDGPQVVTPAFFAAVEGADASDEDCVEDPITQVPEIDASKTAIIDKTKVDPADRVDAGDVITYTVTVKNTGNLTLTDVKVTDPLVALDETIASLAPGESKSYEKVYIITLDDLNLGSVQNCYAAEGDGPVVEVPEVSGILAVVDPVATDDDCLITELEQQPEIDLEKTSTAASGADGVLNPGETITYTFTVTNTGNVTLTNVVLTDPLPGLTWDGAGIIASLAPGESADLTATYVVTETDGATGNVKNCADVTGMAPDETEVTDQSCVTNPVTPNPTPTVPVVDDLPKTGSGNRGGVASVIWAAAAFSIMLLGAGAIGTRRQHR